MLRYYLIWGTILRINEDTGDVNVLKLVRIKIKLAWELECYANHYALPDQSPIDRIGCNLKL